jgi:hypothetical protein
MSSQACEPLYTSPHVWAVGQTGMAEVCQFQLCAEASRDMKVRMLDKTNRERGAAQQVAAKGFGSLARCERSAGAGPGLAFSISASICPGIRRLPEPATGRLASAATTTVYRPRSASTGRALCR